MLRLSKQWPLMLFIMKKLKRLTFIALVLFSYQSSGQASLTVTPAIAASREALTWSIAGNLNGANPNVLSELQWNKVKGVGYGCRLELKGSKRMVAFTNLGQEHTLSGTVTDRDYSQDNRRNEVFSAREDASKGHVLSATAGLGHRVVDRGWISATVYAGYGYLGQQLSLINPGTGLNSRYTNHWYGPLISGKVCFNLTSHLNIGLQSTYHQVGYRASGDWNLISEFEHPVSFRHRAKGFGLDHDIFIQYAFTKTCSVRFGARHSYWTTGQGIDTLYKSDGTQAKTRLNDVTRRGEGLSVGVVVRM